MDIFIQHVVNGLALGSIYALIALGYTMVYGVLSLINFAHGEVFMVAAYIAVGVASALGGVPFGDVQGVQFGVLEASIVMLASIMGAAALGVSIERFAYRPVRSAPRLTPLITAIGVSLLLQNLGRIGFGSEPKRFPEIIGNTTRHIGPITVTDVNILIFVVSIVMMVLLDLLVQKTWIGKAMRALSVNIPAARLMGINVDRVIAATFAIGSSLAAVGSVLYGTKFNQIDPYIGVMTGLKAFVAAVLGGIGNIHGAVVGGIIIGLAEQITAGYASEYRDAITFVILIVVLIIRPQGIMGIVRQEKV